MSSDDGCKLIDLRALLFETLRGVKAGSIDLDRARAINELGKSLIDSAKVEVDYLRVTDAAGSDFIDGPQQTPGQAVPGIVGRTVHRLK